MTDTSGYDAQDVAEVFDEDNTNEESQRYSGREDAEQFEDLVDVYDVTTRAGDRDDDEAAIGEEMDDDEIVADAEDRSDADLEDDDLFGRDAETYKGEDDRLDVRDGLEKQDPHEVELTYAGDLTDVAGASSSAAELESDELDDDDLRDLDYKE